MLEELRPHWRSDGALPDRIERLLRGDRRLGSRDRRLYRELIYTTLRYLPWIEPTLDSAPEEAESLIAWLCAETPSTRGFRAEVGAGRLPCPETTAAKAALLGADPDRLLPGWLPGECPEAFAPLQRDALCSRSPLWIRLQTDDPASVRAEFAARGWPASPSPLLPGAWAIGTEADLTATESFQYGRFEVQDVGSQLILAAAGIEPGGRWLDACAGAGGKTLQLASLLGPAGRVDAFDLRREALNELLRRAGRAGLADRRIFVPSVLAPAYDGVLVDAPCSGSGTWRRQPHLKWTTTPAAVADYARRQAALLEEFAPRVRPGGRLIYATCSLCRSENEAVVGRFLAASAEFIAASWPQPRGGEPRPPAGLRFWPADHNGDGFFAAAFRRRG